ncbi:hypothetical protein Q669_29545 [Labrenzia sp. C1B10]|uniref:hypothetical protein n=1 Tax=unclassified Labrenzia TaxID=2648686 RepID=UPI0003B9195F|nr:MULTISPECIES: hypothetical protein [unclassified Labrenzia]ERP95715.1 hypothetical protein Q669_29545 [Labrenzia sp. C1B10]ERS05781.1 hypothetical protein Q675_29110 [Labrenzia sp. C1B70]
MTLEEALRDAIKRGFLHLSLDLHFGADQWRATYRNTDNANVVYVEDPDPIEAIRKALKRYRGPVNIKEPTSAAAKKAPAKRSRRTRDDDDLI